MVPVFKNVGERSTAKNYCPVSLLSVISKVCEKLVINRIVVDLEKCGLFSDLHYGFRSFRSTADLLKVATVELLGLLTGFRKTPAAALDIFKAFKHFTNLSPMELQVSYLALFLLFLVIDSFKWFWMGNLHKNIRLMLGFLKAPFLALHFFYYTLMIFLIMLSVILLSMLMILRTSLSMIKHLICGNNLNWLLNLNLIYKILWTGGRSGLLISMLGKLN